MIPIPNALFVVPQSTNADRPESHELLFFSSPLLSTPFSTGEDIFFSISVAAWMRLDLRLCRYVVSSGVEFLLPFKSGPLSSNNDQEALLRLLFSASSSVYVAAAAAAAGKM